MQPSGISLKRLSPFAQGAAIYGWLAVLSALAGTDVYYSVYYSVYILLGLLGLLSMCSNQSRSVTLASHQRWILGLTACLFSGCVALADYVNFSPITALQNLFELGLCLLGGFVVGWNLLLFLFLHTPLTLDSRKPAHPGRVFGIVFGSIAAIDLICLFFAFYPGILTADSFNALSQILGNKPYSNRMPIWHTFLVQVFFELGMGLFGDANAAMALFHSAQCLAMAAVFGYTVMTLYQIGVPRFALVIIYCLYALMPHNIVYSATMWKDIPFALAALLFITALYRILRQVGSSQRMNYILFAVGALGFCLWRSNGWMAFLATGIVMTPLLFKTRRSLLLLILAVLVVSWVLLNPVLTLLGVSGLDFVEALGIPMQQVARVVSQELWLSESELALLEEIFDLELVKQLYDPYSVDPIKFQTLYRDKLDFFQAHMGDYLKLYIQVGLRYPGEYVKAWVDETKGYWNAGYVYWVYTYEMYDNGYNIFHTQMDSPFAKLLTTGFRYLSMLPVLQFLTSIGLYTWTVASCFLINALKKRQEYLLTLPILAMVATLIITTPVFCEFRYAYAMIIAAPLIVAVTLFHREQTPS